jgi:membrane-associated phospholipid phosphatase
MNRAGRKYLFALLVSTTLYWFSALVNSLPLQRGRLLDLSTELDTAITFSPHGIWLYILYYPLLLYPLLGRHPIEEAVRLGRAILLFSSFAFLLFLLFPVECPRPPDNLIGESLSSRLLRLVYFLDRPNNCFPSLHVLHSWIISVHFIRIQSERIEVRLGLLLAAIGVTVSTIIIRQHFFMDVAASIVLFAVATGLATSFRLRIQNVNK